MKVSQGLPSLRDEAVTEGRWHIVIIIAEPTNERVDSVALAVELGISSPIPIPHQSGKWKIRVIQIAQDGVLSRDRG